MKRYLSILILILTNISCVIEKKKESGLTIIKEKKKINENLEVGSTRELKIKYIGSIKSNSDTEFKIILRTLVPFSKKGINNISLRSSYKDTTYNSKIELTTKTIVSKSYNLDQLIDSYGKDLDFIPITIIPLTINGNSKGQTRKVNTTDLIFKKNDNKSSLYSISIDLGKIKI